MPPDTPDQGPDWSLTLVALMIPAVLAAAAAGGGISAAAGGTGGKQ
jgi:hypothetical protein